MANEKRINATQTKGLEKFREELETRLAKLPKEKQVRFAWLCAVQALPFLAVREKEEPFFYWGKNIHKHLLSVLRALDAAACIASYSHIFAAGAANASNEVYLVDRRGAAARAAANAAAKAAAAAAEADAAAGSVAVAAAALAVAKAATTDAANAAAAAALAGGNGSYGFFLQIIMLNLQFVEGDTNGIIQIIFPLAYFKMLERFFADLRKVECAYWADWYESLFTVKFLLDYNRIEEIKARLAASTQYASAAEVAQYMNQWNKENAVRQIPEIAAEEDSLSSVTVEVKTPENADFCGLAVTEADLKKLCEAKYSVLAGENGCGKTRLLKILKSYIKKEEPGAAAIFADFANAYFTSDKAQSSDKNSSAEIVEILLEIDSGLESEDISVCEDFNRLLASDLRPFLSYLLSPKEKRNEKRELKTVRRVFYKNYANFFGLDSGKEDYVTKYLQEFVENFSLKSPGQRVLCYFALLVSLAQVKGKKIYLLIDEPESHMHQKRMIAFIDALRGLQNASDQIKIIIATHSPYIVAKSAFNELLFIKDGRIQKKSHTYKLDMLETLMGGSGENLLYDIYTDTFCAFVAECLEPAKPEGVKKTYVYDELRPLLNDLLIGMWLDFGAGEGRLADNLDSISGQENFAKTNCLAYEYVHPDDDSKEERERKRALLSPLYKEALINEELDDYVKTESNKFPAVFMVNVLHEIPIDQWVVTFEKIANALCEGGRLIFCETMILSMGEQENFIVLDKEAIVELFGVDDKDVDFLNEKVIYAIINSTQLQEVTGAKVLKALQSMGERYKSKYLEEKESRKKAFYGCSYINIETAIGEHQEARVGTLIEVDEFGKVLVNEQPRGRDSGYLPIRNKML
jgi:predicted ATPase